MSLQDNYHNIPSSQYCNKKQAGHHKLEQLTWTYRERELLFANVASKCSRYLYPLSYMYTPYLPFYASHCLSYYCHLNTLDTGRVLYTCIIARTKCTCGPESPSLHLQMWILAYFPDTWQLLTNQHPPQNRCHESKNYNVTNHPKPPSCCPLL